MKPVAIAHRYARALADVAGGDAKRLDGIASELDLLASVLSEDAKLRRFLTSRSVRADQKEAVLATLADKAKLSDVTRRFLGVLDQNGRLEVLPEIAAAFGEIADQTAGIVPAEATVAVKLNETDVEALAASIEKMTGRKVRLSVKVDPAVLGGARTRVGSRVYDGTLRTQLEALHKRLSA